MVDVVPQEAMNFMTPSSSSVIVKAPREAGSIGWTTAIFGSGDSLPSIAGDVWRLVPTELTVEFENWQELFDGARTGLRPDLLIIDMVADPAVAQLALDSIAAKRFPAFESTVVLCFTGANQLEGLPAGCDVACPGMTEEQRAAGLRLAMAQL